ncbi:MAG: UMP kinase [Candidatus Aminicenantes bacterium 4484_214]|nr:MAG: UMP kinase [Candidatus Aminicenantes bacterium 4484_214]RLE09304.1 MAG: UMP kinase [Candidatus Aminicenantes bacterium]
MSSTGVAYNRVLLKLSGESFLGDKPYGIDLNVVRRIAQEISQVHALGTQVAIMIGGGNIFRGIKGAKEGMERVSADYMGLLATVINAVALQEALEREGLVTRHVSAIEVKAVAEPFVRRRVLRHLEKGRVIIFSAGIGSPFFTTDTAAALRALEIEAEAILKATKVDGVYSTDPVQDPQAKFFSEISYLEVINQNLLVMDTTAISLCKEHNLPIIVFNLKKKGNIVAAVKGDRVGTIIH